LVLATIVQVVDKMQSGGTSNKNNRRAELPTIGLGEQVIKDLETLKAKDVEWQGKCSGTVYVLHLSQTIN
jgi:sphinganine-1-phosphate aldolase